MSIQDLMMALGATKIFYRIILNVDQGPYRSRKACFTDLQVAFPASQLMRAPRPLQQVHYNLFI
jgi:hypothetical protein